MTRFEASLPSSENIAFGGESFRVEPPDDSSPEGRRIMAERVLTFLKKTGTLELLKDAEERDRFFEKQTAQDLLHFMERLNGVVTGIPIKPREVNPNDMGMIGNDVGDMIVYVAPRPVASKQIFESDIFPKLKELPLHEAASLLATEINLMHIFPDGNGRLARLMFLLLAPLSEKAGPGARETLIEEAIESRAEAYNWSPGLIGEETNELLREIMIKEDGHLSHVKSSNGILEVSPLLNEKDSANLYGMERLDPQDFFLASLIFLKSDRKYRSERYVIKGTEERGDMIDTKKLFENITSSQVTELASCYEKVKLRRLTLFAEIYKEPERFKSIFEKANLKQYYEALVYAVYARQKMSQLTK